MATFQSRALSGFGVPRVPSVPSARRPTFRSQSLAGLDGSGPETPDVPEEPSFVSKALDFGKAAVNIGSAGVGGILAGQDDASRMFRGLVDKLPEPIRNVIPDPQAPFREAWERSARENLAGRDPEKPLGVAESIALAPGGGRVLAEAIAPGTPTSAGGRIAKNVGGLVGDIATDPLTYVTGGLGAAAQAAKAGKIGTAGLRALASAPAGLVYAPELLSGVKESGGEALSKIGQGDFAGAVEPGVQAALLSGLGALMATGAVKDAGDLMRRFGRVSPNVNAPNVPVEAPPTRLANALNQPQAEPATLDDFIAQLRAENPRFEDVPPSALDAPLGLDGPPDALPPAPLPFVRPDAPAEAPAGILGDPADPFVDPPVWNGRYPDVLPDRTVGRVRVKSETPENYPAPPPSLLLPDGQRAMPTIHGPLIDDTQPFQRNPELEARQADAMGANPEAAQAFVESAEGAAEAAARRMARKRGGPNAYEPPVRPNQLDDSIVPAEDFAPPTAPSGDPSLQNPNSMLGRVTRAEAAFKVGDQTPTDLRLVPDRRAEEVTAEPERRTGPERRAELARELELDPSHPAVERLAVAEEQATASKGAEAAARTEADTDVMTGLGSRRAWEAASPNAKASVSFDVAGLGWMNDTHGHGAGDSLLKAVGDAIREEPGTKGFRTGGDEFYIHAESREAADAAARSVQERLAKSTIRATKPDGSVVSWTGGRVDYGVGIRAGEADAALLVARAAATAAGQRGPKGTRPQGLVEVVPSGDSVRRNPSTPPEVDPPLARGQYFDRSTGRTVEVMGSMTEGGPLMVRDQGKIVRKSPDSLLPLDERGQTIYPGEEDLSPEARKVLGQTARAMVRGAKQGEKPGKRVIYGGQTGRSAEGSVSVVSPKRGTALEGIDAGAKEMDSALRRDKANPLELEVRSAVRNDEQFQAYLDSEADDVSFNTDELDATGTDGPVRESRRPVPGQRGLEGVAEDVPQARARSKAPEQRDMFGGEMLQQSASRTTEGREADGALFRQEQDARERGEAGAQRALPSDAIVPGPDGVRIVPGRFELTRGKFRAEGQGEASNWHDTEAAARADLSRMVAGRSAAVEGSKRTAAALERAKAGSATDEDVRFLVAGAKLLTPRRAQGLLRDMGIRGQAMEKFLRTIPGRIMSSGDYMRDPTVIVERAAKYLAGEGGIREKSRTVEPSDPNARWEAGEKNARPLVGRWNLANPHEALGPIAPLVARASARIMDPLDRVVRVASKMAGESVNLKGLTLDSNIQAAVRGKDMRVGIMSAVEQATRKYESRLAAGQYEGISPKQRATMFNREVARHIVNPVSHEIAHAKADRMAKADKRVAQGLDAGGHGPAYVEALRDVYRRMSKGRDMLRRHIEQALDADGGKLRDSLQQAWTEVQPVWGRLDAERAGGGRGVSPGDGGSGPVRAGSGPGEAPSGSSGVRGGGVESPRGVRESPRGSGEAPGLAPGSGVRGGSAPIKPIPDKPAPTKGDKVLEAWRAGLVSAPGTLFVANPLGNLAEQVVRMGETATSSVVDRFFKGGKTRLSGEVKAEFAGAAKVAPGAVKAFLGDVLDAFRLAPEKANPDAIDRQVGAIGGKTGKAVRIPFRILQAGDDLFKTIGGSAELHKLAWREAGGSRAKFDAIRANPSEELLSRVAESKKARTFQDPNKMAESLVSLRSKHKWLNVVMPFVQTPANIASITLKRSPLGFYNAAESYKTYRKAISAGADAKTIEKLRGDAVDAIARPLLGTVILGTFAAYAKAGGMTGSGPVDQKEKSLLRETGWQPYSFVIGEEGSRTYVPYARFEPVSSLLGFAADIVEAKDAKSAGDYFDKGLGSIVENLTSKTYLRGIADAAELVNDPKRFAGQYASNLAGSVVPNVVKKAAQVIDPKLRDVRPQDTGWAGIPERIGKTVASGIPGLSKTLPERRAVTGESIERPGNAVTRLLSPIQPTKEKAGRDLEGLMVDLGVSQGAPQRQVTIPRTKAKVQLTPAEYSYLQDKDKAATEFLRRQMKDTRFKRLAPEQQRAYIERVYRKAGDEARNRILQRSEFKTRARKAVQESRADA